MSRCWVAQFSKRLGGTAGALMVATSARQRVPLSLEGGVAKTATPPGQDCGLAAFHADAHDGCLVGEGEPDAQHGADRGPVAGEER